MNLENPQLWKSLKLFIIGIFMGIADLIPGISGGTIAFLTGIYGDLLTSIQSFKIQGFRKIAWSFLLPLGAGIALSFLSLTPLFSFLLNHSYYSLLTYAFFFGVISASTLLFTRKLSFKRGWQWPLLIIMAASVVLISSFSKSSAKEFDFYYLIFCGALASSAMLLPGISGSYVLYLLGVYQVAISSLSNQSNLLTFILPLGIGIILGLLLFSRVITFFLNRCPLFTMTALTGFMIGGLMEIWPFQKEEIVFPIFFAALGFTIVWGIDLLVKSKSLETRFKD